MKWLILILVLVGCAKGGTDSGSGESGQAPSKWQAQGYPTLNALNTIVWNNTNGSSCVSFAKLDVSQPTWTITVSGPCSEFNGVWIYTLYADLSPTQICQGSTCIQFNAQ